MSITESPLLPRIIEPTVRPGSRSLPAGIAFVAVALVACVPTDGAYAQQGADSGHGAQPPSAEGVARLDAEALLVRGLTQARLGKLDLALASLSSALQLAPNEAAIASAVAAVYARLGDFESAEFHARRAYALDPRLEYGQALESVLVGSGKTDRLNEIRADLRKRFPHTSRPIELTDSSRGAGAVETGRSAAQADLDDSSDALVAARALLDAGQIQDAVEVFERLVAEDVRVEANWIGLASSLYQSGDVARAATTAQEGLVLFPGSTPLLIQSARAVIVHGTRDEAERITQAIESVADEKGAEEAAQLLAFAALIANAHGLEYSDRLDRALLLDRTNQLAIGEVSRRAAEAGDYASARRHLAALPPLGANDWEAAEAAGRAWMSLDEPESAWFMFATALAGPYPSALLIDTATEANRRIGESAAARSLLAEARTKLRQHHETSERIEN